MGCTCSNNFKRGLEEAVHREVIKLMVKKMKKENGNHSFDKITGVRADLEKALWKPTVEKINKAKSRLRNNNKCEPKFCSSHISKEVMDINSREGGKLLYENNEINGS